MTFRLKVFKKCSFDTKSSFCSETHLRRSTWVEFSALNYPTIPLLCRVTFIGYVPLQFLSLYAFQMLLEDNNIAIHINNLSKQSLTVCWHALKINNCFSISRHENTRWPEKQMMNYLFYKKCRKVECVFPVVIWRWASGRRTSLYNSPVCGWSSLNLNRGCWIVE